ncbi:MAG: 6-phosphofructokinase [Polyangiaceae bacterium]|nr:6-phosphofructokinase [Polyangiaceae bacterium]
MTRLAVLTSGGDAPGMNAAIRTLSKLCPQRGVELEAMGFTRTDKRRLSSVKSEGVEIPCTRLVREVQTLVEQEIGEARAR